MSLAGPLATAQNLPSEAPPAAVQQRVRLVRLPLNNGWTARIRATDTDSEGMTAANAMQQWRDWLRDPLNLVANVDRRALLKTSSTTTVCRIQLRRADGHVMEAVFKRGKSRHLRKRVLNLFRTSRPSRTCRRAQALLAAGIGTARPLAVLERRRFGLLLDSVFITEYLPNAIDLENLLTVGMRELAPATARVLKGQLAEALARFILDLQAARFFHRDLKALNVIVQWNPQTAEAPLISLVDLDGLKPGWQGGTRGWQRMLMRLNVSVDAFRRVSLADRVRLLKRYLALTGDAKAWKAAWRDIAALSQRKRVHRDRAQERSFKKYGRY